MKYNIILTQQNDQNLITFSMNAKDLLKLVHFKSRFEDPEEGIQRSHNIKKSRKIADAIISGDLSIPNSIIVNLNLRGTGINIEQILVDNNTFLDIDNAVSILSSKRIDIHDLFFVIDGQHRLRAFEFDDVPDFNVIVTSYIDLYIADIANLFVQINYNQKPVDKSIVYDLLGINENIFPEYAKYHRIVTQLNNDVESPFFDQIKMLGVGEGYISQASIITALEKYRVEKRLYNIGVQLNEMDFYYLLKIYFNILKEEYNNSWIENSTLLTKSIGIRSMIKLLPDVIEYVLKDNESISKESIFNCIKHLDHLVVDYINIGSNENIWQYFSKLGIGGEGGISNLHKLFVSILLGVE